MIIAIDGPAASGKGTLAKKLATHFNLACLDTGRLYRALGSTILKDRKDPKDLKVAVNAVKKVDLKSIQDIELYTEKVAEYASIVASFPEVRKELLGFQREFANYPPKGKLGAVLDGRDIGSVVCPGADYKFFVTASQEVRALRRYKQLQENGLKGTYASVLADIEQRDERDRTRKVSPLKVVDALVVDTSDKTPNEVFTDALSYINPK